MLCYLFAYCFFVCSRSLRMHLCSYCATLILRLAEASGVMLSGGVPAVQQAPAPIEASTQTAKPAMVVPIPATPTSAPAQATPPVTVPAPVQATPAAPPAQATPPVTASAPVQAVPVASLAQATPPVTVPAPVEAMPPSPTVAVPSPAAHIPLLKGVPDLSTLRMCCVHESLL